jgi:copper oxidase (laccase) domain-containing protein
MVVGAPAPAGCGSWAASGTGPPDGDAVVGVGGGWCLGVLTADCAPVALGSPEGIHAAVHVGWRGLSAGVVARAVDAMGALGASAVVGGLGPTIHPCCYEFSAPDLDAVAGLFGDEVRAATRNGAPALDLPAGVRRAMRDAGVAVVVDLDRCTACGGDAFSHRGCGDDERQALYVWRSPGSGAR